jgi:hypothetical protein
VNQDARACFRGAGMAAALAVGLAMLVAPAARSQTTGAATNAADVSKLPVCGTRAGASARARPASAAQRLRTAVRRVAESAATQPVQGTLTLDQEDQETVTSAAFGRSKDPQPLTLVYRVAGCRVTDRLPLPSNPLRTGPVKSAGSRMLPLGAVHVDDADADGDRYVVHLRILASSDGASDQPRAPGRRPSASHDFTVKAGSYTSFVRLKANWMRPVATPVTVTRSESQLWMPIGIGIAGAGCGFLLFWLARQIHHEDLLVRDRVLWFTAAASIIVGAGSAFFTNYLNQDVWTWNANGLALFTAAFSASTAGVAAGLLTGIYKNPTVAKEGADGGTGEAAEGRK